MKRRGVFMNSIDDIIDLHSSSGSIEEAIKKIHIDDKYMNLNTFTLRVFGGNVTKKEKRNWDIAINNAIKRERNLYKEVHEYLTIFEFLNKIGFKSGYIEKSEKPDFILSYNNKKYGIEVSKIYVGNEWVASRINEEIKQYKLRQKELEGYIEYRNYQERIKTFKIRGGLAIMPIAEDISLGEYIIEIKSKILEKIRKLLDIYKKNDVNIILVNVISPLYFNEAEEIEQLNKEFKKFISNLEEKFDDKEYYVVLKTTENWTKFNLKTNEFETL
jgi:HAMP domain-containing protein